VQPSGTVTLLFTDIEGSTRAWETWPAEMQVALARHDVVVRESIVAAGGHVFKTVGDAFCAAFADTRSAVAAAVGTQHAVAVEPWPEVTPIRVRLALHLGECEERDGDYFGPTVNRVARLLAVGHGGQTLVSGATAEVARDRLPAGVRLRDLGEHRLKDLGRPEHVFQVDVDGLPEEFPPLRSLDNPQLLHNLPEQVSSFVGRDRELGEIRELFDVSRCVTLTGPGGVGKTRLALQAAAEQLDGSGDGVWLVELAPLADGDLIGEAVASAFGVREVSGRSMVDVVTDALRDQDLLIVLDNCEHVVDAAAKLVDALLRSCGKLALLATSREPLGIAGEVVYRVPSLGLAPAGDADLDLVASSEAVRLFVERARLHNRDFVVDDANAETVAGVCRRLDGIPLGIELAASRVRSLTLDEIDGRLDQRFRLLTGGSRTARERQQTLRATVDWSYDLLTVPEQRLFARLSVFPAAFDLDAAEAVSADADVETFGALDLLTALVDKSLVSADDTGGTTRYWLLETLRTYAAERLAEDGIDAVAAARYAHRDHYLALAETAAPHLRAAGQVAWFDRLDNDHDSVRAALTTSLDDPDPIPLLRLAAALDDFWTRRGRLDDEALDNLAAHVANQQPSRLHARALASVAHISYTRGDGRSGRRLADQAIVEARDLHDDAIAAHALSFVAEAALRQGDTGDALSINGEALALAEHSGDPHLIARVTSMRGLIMSGMGQRTEARLVIRKARETFRQCGDKLREAICVNDDALNELLQDGDVAAVHADFQYVLAVFRELGSSGDIGYALANVALVEILSGDPLTAHQHLTEALPYTRRAGDQAHFAYIILGFALVESLRNQPERAAKLHGAADILLATLGEVFDPLEVRLRNDDHSRLRGVLGDAGFREAYTRGRALTRDEAITLALDHGEDHDTESEPRPRSQRG
jgi:predicted ATPase/class 3 adenylate cyclase